MDLSSILNRPSGDGKRAAAVAHEPPSRLSHAAHQMLLHQDQLSTQHQHASPTHPSHPSLLRQQSSPSVRQLQHIHQDTHTPYNQQPQTSYAPHRDEYFRDHTLSVSPKSQPHSISRHPSYDLHAQYDSVSAESRPVDGHYSTPSRAQTRQPSLQSLASNSATGYREVIHAREPQTHSPHLTQAPSVTSSPMQSRSAEHYTPTFTHSPLESRTSFRPTTQSPLQTSRHSPVTVKSMAPPSTPSQPTIISLSQPPEPHYTPAFPSPSLSKTAARMTPLSSLHDVPGPTKDVRHEQPMLEDRRASQTSIDLPQPAREAALQKNATPPSSRKRSLESAEEMAPPAKRARYPAPPKWAQRAQWKTPLRTMEQWIPHPRTAPPVNTEPKPRLQRVPSVAQPAQQSRAEQRNDQGHGTEPHANGTGHAEGARDFDVSPVGKYELSLDGHVPFSDITREVARFLYANVVTAPELGIGSFEVEAKLGHLIDPRTSSRLQLPISTEAVLQEGHEYRFQSHMTIAQHKRMNEYLNTETRRTQQPNSQRAKIQYEHLRETDRFFEMPKEFFQSLPEPVKNIQNAHRHAPRVRVTVDQKSGQVKAAIYKLKVRDLEIYCPADDFDVRISVALEIKYPHPVDGLAEQSVKSGDSGARFKDRLSYKHQFVSVDLTQVTDAGQKKQELELEIETALLRDEGLRADAGLPNQYEGICGIFTNYIRVMNRTCRQS